MSDISALKKSVREAIANNDLDTLNQMITRDINTLQLEFASGSILHVAISLKKPEVVRLLLGHGLDPNIKSENAITSCLGCAIGNQDIGLVRLLLDYGAVLDTSETTTNPLYAAIYYGNLEIANLLVDRGLDVNVQYKAKPPHTNALLFAKTWGRTDIVKLIESKLLQASPEAGNLAPESATTPTSATKAARTAKPMIEKSKLTEIRDAIRNRNLDTLNQLVESDSNVIQLDSAFGSILHIALGIGSPDVVRWLLQRGADPNSKSKYEETSCLNRAIGKRNIELVRLLLDHGTALDTTDTVSNPLYAAIYYGEFEIAKLLVDRGLDVNVQYKAKPPHTNALLFAKTWGRTDIVKLIESKLPQASPEAGNLAPEFATTSASSKKAAKSAKPKSKSVKVDQAGDWSLHYVFEGDKPVRFREFRISGNSLWTTQGDVMTWGDTQRSDFDSPVEAGNAFGNASEQALTDGFELYRSGDADKAATDRKALTLEIQQGAKKAFEATRRNHPDAPPAMFGLQSDDDATLIVSVSNPRIDIDSVDQDELERVWILNLWEYDEGSEYLDPAYRLLLLPHHGDPLPSGGLSPQKVYDCFVDALAALRKEGFFGTPEESPVVLFQVLDSLAHVDQNKKLNSPEVFRKYRSWVRTE